MLELRLFGPPRVISDGRGVAFDTRKAVALLAHLGVTGRSRSREQLAALLWPEYDDAHARGALRRTLSTTRSALPDATWLEVDRSRVALAAEVSCDVAEFQSLTDATRLHDHEAIDRCTACLGRLAAAAELYTDEFMAGFALRDSPEFDDWQAQQAEDLRRTLASALDTLASAAARRGVLDVAIAHTRRLLRMDALNEAAHRTLIDLHARNGERSVALRQYRDCVRVLDEELGVGPLPETTELYERVLAGNASSPLPRSSAPEPAIARSQPRPPSPLIGRDRELATLMDGWRAVGDSGRVVRVEGEAGIGKTRLVAEALDRFRGGGARTLALRCFEGEAGLAYAPVADALGRLADAELAALTSAASPDALHEAARIAPALVQPRTRPAAPDLDEPAASLRLVHGLATVFDTLLAGPVPGVLWVDDAQWADQATAALLGYVIRRLSGYRLYVIVASRRTPEQVDLFRAALGVAAAEGRLDDMPLERLTDAACRELLHSAMPMADDSLVASLTTESEGNPYFLLEYIAQLAREPIEGEVNGPAQLPPRVRELVASRLVDVHDVALQVLGAAAILGRTFGADVVERVSGRSEVETLAALERLRALGLVVERGAVDAGPAWDFDHDKTRDVVLDQMAVTRRRALHRRAATVLQSWSLPGGRRPLAAIAGHFIAAGDPVEGANWHRLAGDEAAALHANADAIGHYSAAVALAPHAAGGVRARIGDLEKLRGRYPEALAAYRAELATATGGDVPDLEHRMARVHLRLGEWEVASAYLKSALKALPADAPGARAAALVDASLASARLGNDDAARRNARRALKSAVAAGDSALQAEAHNQLGLVARGAGVLEDARHHLTEALRLAETGASPAAGMAARNNLARLELAEGDVVAAERLTRDALRTAVEIGDRHREAALRSNLADLLHGFGQTDEAMAEQKHSVALFADIGEPMRLQPEIWKLVDW